MLLSAALERCVWLEPYTCVYSYMCIETNVCMHICMYLLSSLTYIHSFGEWLSPVPTKSYGFLHEKSLFSNTFLSPWGPPTGPLPLGGGKGHKGTPWGRSACSRLLPPPMAPPERGFLESFDFLWISLDFLGFSSHGAPSMASKHAS